MAANFNDLGQLMKLAQNIDMKQLANLSEKVDLEELIGMVSSMDERTLAQMTNFMRKQQRAQNGNGRELPPVTGDFFDLRSTFSDEQRAVQDTVRDFMETHVQPIANEYWQKDTFPRHLIDEMRKLNILPKIFHPDGTRTHDAAMMEGIVTMEMARIDVSTATFFGVHGGLALWSMVMAGTEAQKEEWLPKMLNLDVIGAFGLTEPKVGSAISQGMRTTCRHEGDTWILNGEKKWIGNATFADMIIIWARDEDTDEVRGFLVRPENPGYHVDKIENKIALRMVENGHITLTDCEIPEADHLSAMNGWSTVAEILRQTRAGVAWQGVGCAMGAYEHSARYARKRKQFGRPISAFQLIQDKLVFMLGNVTAMQTMCLRLADMQDAGTMRDEHASLAKVFTAARCRDTVALARDLHGGNGILLEHDVARFFCDTEAIYSYEGTNEINSLVVGRAVTGQSAFV